MTALLKLEGYTLTYPRQTEPALIDISLELAAGEKLAVIGESGSGKSTLARAVACLNPRDTCESGTISWPSLGRSAQAGSDFGMVFQDPLTSLNPLYTIGQQLIETIRRHLPLNQGQARQRAIDLLAEAGIPSPADRLDSYPHQFSGGMRQRVVIALALAAEPELIIADEPTSALMCRQAPIIRS